MTNQDLFAALKENNYSDRFRKFMLFIFKWENVVGKGGKILVENDPDDPGGATFCGLDRRSHPNLNFNKITPKDVCDSYLKDYWSKFNCENYNNPLGEVIMNCCVNAGWGRAKQILDKVGKNAEKFIEEQESFYKRLAAARPKSKKYLAGWLNRTYDLKKFLGLDSE